MRRRRRRSARTKAHLSRPELFRIPRAFSAGSTFVPRRDPEEATMGGIIYLVGLIVIILAILSFLGLR
jgi:hypothetical protein